MEHLLGQLTRQPQEPIDLLLHIGAGPAPETLRLPGVRRLVLVEGDAGTRVQLALSTAGRPGLEVWPDTVLPTGGLTPWRRYTLPLLNGPLNQSSLTKHYPRLQPLGESVSAGTAIDRLVERALADAPAGRAVLVLDLPGQEAALLDALPLTRLHAFGHLLVRVAAHGQGEGCTRADTERKLAQADYRLVAGDEEDPLWPVLAFALDHTAAFRRERDALQRACSAEIESERSGRSDALRQVAELSERLQRQQAQATEIKSADDAEIHALRSRLESLEQDRLAAAEMAREREAALAAELVKTTSERDQQRQWHQENAASVRNLAAQVAELEAAAASREQAALQARLQADEKDRQDRAHLEQTLQALTAENSVLRARVAELEDLVETQTAAASAQTAEAARLRQAMAASEAQWRQQSADIESSRRDAEQRAAALTSEREQRSLALDRELLRAEAQLDLIKDVLLREKNF